MAKKMKLASNVAPIAPLSTTLAVLLDSMQTRISDAAARGAANSDEISKVEHGLGNELAAAASKAHQELADHATGTTNALVALKVSTQRAVDGITTDITSITNALQREQARTSALQGRIASLEIKENANRSTTSTLENELKFVLQRYGYKVTDVAVKKTTYPNGSDAVGSSEAIQIEINGHK